MNVVYHMTSPERAKRVAKDLKARLDADAIEVGHSQALEIVSRMLGYEDWNDLQARHASAPPSWDDGFEDAQTARERGLQQICQLALGLPLPFEQAAKLATSVVGDIRPTMRVAPGPGQWSKMAEITGSTADRWRESLVRSSGIWIVGSASRSIRAAAFYDTVREIMGAGVPTQINHEEMFPEDIARSVEQKAADCVVYHFDAMRSGDVEGVVQLAEEGRMVVMPCFAQSAEQVFDKLADGHFGKRLRHVLRGVLVEAPLAGRKGGTVNAAECVVLQDAVQVDARLNARTRQHSEFQGKSFDYSTILGDAAIIHSKGWVELGELHRSFGRCIDEWIERLSNRAITSSAPAEGLEPA